MTRGRYPADRRPDLMNVAAAVVGSAAAAQVIHRETANPHDLTATPPTAGRNVVNPRWASRPWDQADHSHHPPEPHRCGCTCEGVTVRNCPEHGERAYRYTARGRVVDAAREYFRTGGDSSAHHELLDAVAQLERARLAEEA